MDNEDAGAARTRESARALMEAGSLADLDLDDDELRRMTPGRALTLRRKVIFLRALAVRGITRDGCVASGVARGTADHWRANDEWFDELFGYAVAEACDNLEAEAHRRAVEGVDEPVIYQGMPTTVTGEDGRQRMLTVKRYSDSLLQLLLKGNMPDKYRENAKVDVSHSAAGGVLIVPGGIGAAEWATAAAEQQAKYAGSTGEDKG